MDSFLLNTSSVPLPYPNASKLFTLHASSSSVNPSSSSSSLLFSHSSASSLHKLYLKLRTSVVVAAKKTKKEANPDSGIEALLLKEKKGQEDGGSLPELVDAEEGLYYDVLYMVNGDCDKDEYECVNKKVEDFINGKKGKIWRQSEWGLRRLAYKIANTSQAHYMLMNIELGAEWINDFKSMLDEDGRIIQHQTTMSDKSITEELLSPPEFQTVGGDMVDEYGSDYDEAYNDEDVDWHGEEDEEMNMSDDDNGVAVLVNGNDANKEGK